MASLVGASNKVFSCTNNLNHILFIFKCSRFFRVSFVSVENFCSSKCVSSPLLSINSMVILAATFIALTTQSSGSSILINQSTAVTESSTMKSSNESVPMEVNATTLTNSTNTATLPIASLIPLIESINSSSARRSPPASPHLIHMAAAISNATSATITRFIAANPIFSNGTRFSIPTYYYGNEFNGSSYYHRIFLNGNNESHLHFPSNCPSIQMPVGSVISMILYAIVCIVGLFGNTLVIYVVLRFSKMQTVTNMYILNLAIADECFLIGIPFLIITMHLGEWTFGKAMCKAYMVSTSITQFTSSIFLFIMSADRYIAVCHPVSSPRYRSPFVSRVVTAVAWTASALIMLPVMLYANTIERENKKMTCNIVWPQDDDEAGSGTTFTLYSLILGFAIPLSLILSFYYLVIRKLQTVGPKTKSKEKKRSHRKVTKLVLTVITVYVLCWLPYWISQVALITSPPDICNTRLEITLFVLVGCLGYSNSAMNPILYAFLSDNFKKSFLKACTCAAGKDFNAQLQLENSFLPRFGKRSSEKFCSSTKAANNALTVANSNRLTQSQNTIACNSATINDDEVIDCNIDNIVANINTPVSTNPTKPTTLNLGYQRPPVLHTDL